MSSHTEKKASTPKKIKKIPNVVFTCPQSTARDKLVQWLEQNEKEVDLSVSVLIRMLLQAEPDREYRFAEVEDLFNQKLGELSVSSWQKRFKALDEVGIIERVVQKNRATIIKPTENIEDWPDYTVLLHKSVSNPNARLLLKGKVKARFNTLLTQNETGDKSRAVAPLKALKDQLGSVPLFQTMPASQDLNIELLIQQLYLLCTSRPNSTKTELETKFFLFNQEATVRTRTLLGEQLAVASDFRLVVQLYSEIKKYSKTDRNLFKVKTSMLAQALYGRAGKAQNKRVAEAMERIRHTVFSVFFKVKPDPVLANQLLVINEDWQAILSVQGLSEASVLGEGFLGEHKDEINDVPDYYQFSIPDQLFQRLRRNQFILKVPESFMKENRWFRQVLLGVLSDMLIATGEDHQNQWHSIAEDQLYEYAFESRIKHYQYKSEMNLLLNDSTGVVVQFHHLELERCNIGGLNVLRYRGQTGSSTKLLDVLPKRSANELSSSEIAAMQVVAEQDRRYQYVMDILMHYDLSASVSTALALPSFDLVELEGIILETSDDLDDAQPPSPKQVLDWIKRFMLSDGLKESLKPAVEALEQPQGDLFLLGH